MMEKLHSSEGRLAQIELLVSLAVFLYLFLVIFGGYRQRYNSKMFRMILRTAYSVPPFLFTYTVGLMNVAPFKNDLFPIWATFLIMLLGPPDSFSSYTIDNNKQWKAYNWQFLMKMMGLALLIPLYANAYFSMIAVGSLCIVVLVKVSKRAWASQSMSKSMRQWTTPWLLVYERMKHPVVVDDVDLTTMKGCFYMVDVSVDWKKSVPNLLWSLWKRVEQIEDPLKSAQTLTVEKVWQCDGKLLKERDPDDQIKDLCLSFALSNILISRFTGHPIPQEFRQTFWTLLQKMKDSNKEVGYQRAFRVIEVELTFLFNRLYTKYPLFNGLGVLNFVKLVFTIIGSSVVASAMLHYQRSKNNIHLTISGFNVDLMVTFVPITAVLILEILQILFICFSKWGKVFWICFYIRKISWQNRFMEKLIEAICRIHPPKPWERKLQHYSLLKSYMHSPNLLLYNLITALFIDQEREGQCESDPIELSEEVKFAVINSILINGTELKIGRASSVRNGMTVLLWACNLETQAEVIMVRHLATSMCEFHAKSNNAPFLKDFKIATSLSKYLAYLVTFAPRLLPDHPYVTGYVLDQLIIKACKTFRSCNCLEDRIRELENKCSQEHGSTVIDKGARLGKQLLSDVKNPEVIWKVLADFWAELMVYVAPSNDVVAHADHLTMGGEFITHIWALVTHCGIKRKSSQEESRN